MAWKIELDRAAVRELDPASSINRRHGVSLPFCIAVLPRWTIRVASGRPSRVPSWASSGSTG